MVMDDDGDDASLPIPVRKSAKRVSVPFSPSQHSQESMYANTMRRVAGIDDTQDTHL